MHIAQGHGIKIRYGILRPTEPSEAGLPLTWKLVVLPGEEI
jgi:hypothetical protein